MARITRRQFLKLGGAAVGGLAAGGAMAYATQVEPQWLRLEPVDVGFPDLPSNLDGFTIIQLSDLHCGRLVSADDIGRAVSLVQQQQGIDLVVLTGDYVSGSARYASSCAKALAPLAAGKVLACLGNHDHWTDARTVAAALADVGITVLCNAAQEVADGLWVAAVDDVWERHADLEWALRRIPIGARIVLLAHEPDYADVVAADGRVSLQLSGHSHGGQVQVPFFGPLVLPHLARRYHTGLYLVGNMKLYVSRGVGLISPPVRLNCRPEVTLVTLRRATPEA